MTRKIGKRKSILLLATLFLLTGLTFAASDRPIRQGTVELIFGSYDMNEPRFDAVYAKGGLMAGLGLSAAITSNVNIYLDMQYFSRTGRLSFSKDKTSFYLVPISLGVRYIYPLGIFNPYIGGGGDFYFFFEDNPIGSVLNYTGGYHVSGGAYLRFSKSIPVLLNLKIKYTWAKVTENNIQIQLGGSEYAAALVFAF